MRVVPSATADPAISVASAPPTSVAASSVTFTTAAAVSVTATVEQHRFRHAFLAVVYRNVGLCFP